MAKHILFILLAVINYNIVRAQQEASIIPAPQSYTLKEGTFTLTNKKLLFADKAFGNELHFLQKELLRYRNITTSISADESNASIILKKADRNCLYKLEITQKNIIISSNSPEGIFYGVISLLQIINKNGIDQSQYDLPCLVITDTPALAWRGLMLDESRHFFGKEKVKSLLDWMAYYKLNRFHWHLTDEPGWRIEIKKYPKLALVGGIGSTTDALSSCRYYTQHDISEVVAYARERHIEVIPEIDMPGHATAANRAYPEYSGGGSEKHPDFTFHPAKEGTYQYLTDILKEVNVLFPSQMIHLGGDEVSFGIDKWKSDAEVQQLMAKEKLADLKSVENYFMQRMADSLRNLNSKLLVWDEMAGANFPKDKSIIFWWRQDKPEQLKLGLENGYQTVACPRLPFYFDFVQNTDHRQGRKWAGTGNELSNVYNFSINKLPVDKKHIPLIIGIQGNLWSETISNEQRLDFLTFPRIAALAESAWTTDDNKNYDAFLERLKAHVNLYKNQRLYFYNPFDPGNHPEPVLW